MSSEPSTISQYKIWAPDDVVYGPVSLQILLQWAQEERILGDSWIHVANQDVWVKAKELAELKTVFGCAASEKPTGEEPPLVAGLRPGMLRRVKALATMNDQQLGRFVKIMEVVTVEAYAVLVQQGTPGDSMYAVLDGEMRARLLVEGKETELARLGPGDVFGEMSLFDGGLRSADIVANSRSTLLRISSDRFNKICREQPEIAAPFLFELAKTLAKRIRADDKRIADVYQLARIGQLE